MTFTTGDRSKERDGTLHGQPACSSTLFIQNPDRYSPILSVLVQREEGGADWAVGAFSSQSLDLSITVDLVVTQYCHLDLLALVLDLLGGSVILLLSLLTTSSKTKHQVQSRLLLNVVVGEGSAVFQLLTSKDQSLLVRRNTFLVLDLSLDIVDSVGRLYLKGNSLAWNYKLKTRKGDEDCVRLRFYSSPFATYPLRS
jgi:hypothetical protein